MWDGIFTLLSYSLVMGVASFVAGYLPLSFSLFQKHSHIISTIGTGILVGTCLIIIIPEGIETLYSSRNRNATTAGDSYSEPHAWVGIPLIFGFVLMYLIDELPKHTSRASSQLRPRHISLANLSQGLHHEGSPTRADARESMELESGERQSDISRGSSTTIGLVIHAAADGIALAASSFLAEASTGLIVFIAVMIHKAPAAFGLTSVLLKQGLSARQAKLHLLSFSLAAPFGAIMTFILVNILGGGRIEGEESTKFATGLLLLFSGGTFLYVAMHTMQDAGHHASESSGSNIYSNGHVHPSDQSRDSGRRQGGVKNVFLGVAGMLLPMIAQLGHTH